MVDPRHHLLLGFVGSAVLCTSKKASPTVLSASSVQVAIIWFLVSGEGSLPEKIQFVSLWYGTTDKSLVSWCSNTDTSQVVTTTPKYSPTSLSQMRSRSAASNRTLHHFIASAWWKLEWMSPWVCFLLGSTHGASVDVVKVKSPVITARLFCTIQEFPRYG